MRSKLLHPLRERSAERHELRRGARRTPPRRPEPRVVAIDVEPSAVTGLADQRDLAAERVRRAGGPLDVAVYTCSCGYLFSAAVSTTVTCPHCGGDQAW